MQKNLLNVVHHKEWLWVLAWSMVILIVTNLPYLYGALVSTSNRQFSGFVIGVEDGNSYLAKMQQGRSGYWLFRLTYTPEVHQGELFFLFYILLGKLAGLTGLSNILVFHLGRLVTILFGLMTFYYFAAYFIPEVKVRRLAWLMFGFGGGLGWLWLGLGGPAEVGTMPVDLWVPDASFFLSSLTYAHLPLAQGLLLLFCVASLEFIRHGQKWIGFAAAIVGLAASAIHPYTLPVIGFILGLYLLRCHYHQKQKFFLSALRLFLVLLPALPYLLYVLLVFNQNPAFIAWRNQSATYSPAPIHYLLGFGFTLILAAIGLGILWRSAKSEHHFLQIWAMSVPVLVYLPNVLQRRFLDGYQAPLVVLAAIGLVWLIEKIPRQFWQTMVVAVILIVMSLTNVFLIGGAVVTVILQPETIFVSAAQIQAADWLAEKARQAVVLSSYSTGNYLPTVADVRVFLGHGPETIHSAQKQKQVEMFFNRTTAETWRLKLLDQFNIRYVYYGLRERALGDFAPDHAPYLQQVYNNDAVQIYRVLALP